MSTINKTTTLDHPAQPRPGRRFITRLGLAAGLIILVVGAALGLLIYRMSYVPADLNLATTRMSAHNLYQATIRPRLDPIPVNQLHSWVLHVETADGQPLDNAAIEVDGDMPQHGHGLPTRPQVTQNLGGGDYLVEGLKFQMGGWWVMDFNVTANGHSDRVSFNLILN